MIDQAAIHQYLRTTSVESVAELLVVLKTLVAVGETRLLLGVRNTENRMLTAPEAAKIAGISARWFWDHVQHLPFARRVAPRRVRFEEAGLRSWLETRK